MGEREKIVEWLRSGYSPEAEELCSKLFELAKQQRASGAFLGQPYFDLFADAIERGAHLSDQER